MPYSEEKPIRRNLRCPHCHFDDLAFVTEYHKAYVWRFFESLCIPICIFIAIMHLSGQMVQSTAIPGMIFFAILWFIFHSIRCYVESKTHVQAICRVCGELWLLN